MNYLDDVLHVFVDEVSLKFNMDLSWILQQPNEWLLTMPRKYSQELESILTRKLDQHNLHLKKNITEIRDVLITGIEQPVKEFSEKFIPLEHLNKYKEQGDEVLSSIRVLANYVDNVKDVVEFAESNMSITELVNYDALKKLTQLASQRYLQNNEKLVISLEVFEDVKAFWEIQAELGNIDAKTVLEELIVSQISRNKAYIENTWVESVIITFSDEETTNKNLEKFAAYFLITESKMFSESHDIAHECIKHSNASLQQAIVYMLGRCIVEIRHAWKEKTLDFSVRLANVIHDIKRELSHIFKEDLIPNLSKVVINYLVNLVSGFLKNIKQALQKGGQYFKVLCDEIWRFISGENQSLIQTITNISKAIAGMAILTFIVGMHQYLISAGLPELFVIVITAFISALMTVAIFRFIEKAAQFTGSVFYTRDVARIRREEVERICEEVLPVIEEKVAQLDILIEQEDRERTEIFNRSFTQIQASLSSIDIDQIVLAYQDLYQYLGKDFPFKNEKEFDDFMLDGKDFII
ncbi:MAG: hypothetical protein E7I55_05785 [Acinetobacter ursingii]|nr:hypothetical protein [Acinetobacter ursingii]